MTALDAADVPEAFSAAAPRYDRMVSLNPGYHQHLRTAAEALLGTVSDRAAVTLVDLGCGSGASTRALLAAAEGAGTQAGVLGIDASAGMLAQASRQGLAGRGPLRQRARARPQPAPGGVGPGRTCRRRVGGVPVPQRDRARRRSGPGARPVGRARHAGGAGVLRGGVGRGQRDLEPGFLAGGDPAQLRDVGPNGAVSLSVGAASAPSIRCRPSSTGLYAAGFVEVDVSTVPGWQQGILHTFRARKAKSSA